MASSLAAFLLDLVMSDEHRNAFVNASDDDKKKMMKDIGLSQRQSNAVINRDLKDILDILNMEFGPKPGDFSAPPW